MEEECPKDLTRGIEDVVEGKDGLGAEKGLRTLERQREGVLWLGEV